MYDVYHCHVGQWVRHRLPTNDYLILLERVAEFDSPDQCTTGYYRNIH
jgi:hypothetical protein